MHYLTGPILLLLQRNVLFCKKGALYKMLITHCDCTRYTTEYQYSNRLDFCFFRYQIQHYRYMKLNAHLKQRYFWLDIFSNVKNRGILKINQKRVLSKFVESDVNSFSTLFRVIPLRVLYIVFIFLQFCKVLLYIAVHLYIVDVSIFMEYFIYSEQGQVF